MNGPAKVLVIIDGLGLSGKTKAMVDLVTRLDPDRYGATVVRLDLESSPLEAELRRAGVEVVDLPCPDGLNLEVVLRLGALARSLRPSVIHCYNPRTMLYGGLVARATGARATLGTLSAFACLTPDTEYRFLPQKLASASRRNRWRNRLAAGLVRRLVTVSPSLGRGFCRYNGISETRLRVISYGVDLDRFARVTDAETAAFRAEHRLPPDALVIGSVGRLVEQKDYPTQLRAFAAARARHPAMYMLLVGDGPLRAELEALVRDLGIADAVRFAGHRNDAPVALRAIDVYVIASKFEPYGVALLEAKAAGAAIVATSVNEIPDILGGAGGATATGRLVPPEDFAAMADAFVEMAANAEARRALGARAARDAAERHSLRAVISAYQGLYDEARGLSEREVGPIPAL